MNSLGIGDLKQGQACYRENRYKAALYYFNRTVGQMHPNVPAEVWDQRATAFAKLGKWNAALTDAKECMRAAPASPIGYLRAGRVLQKMGRERKALAVCRRGLDAMADADDLKASFLRRLHDELVAHAPIGLENPDIKVDPSQVLPIELFEMVADRLPFHQMVVLQQVSKTWREKLRALPSLWRHLDLSTANSRYRPGMSFIKACVQNARGQLTHATLSQRGSPKGKDVPTYILTFCKKLESLCVPHNNEVSFLTSTASSPRLKSLHIGCPVSASNIIHVLNHCATLEHATFLRIHKGDECDWSGPPLKLCTLTLGSECHTREHRIDLVSSELTFDSLPNSIA